MNYETDYYKEFEERHNMTSDLDDVMNGIIDLSNMNKKEAIKIQYHTVHLRKFNEFEVSNTGGMTLCIHDCEAYFAVAKAICSDQDQFCRKTGRELAQHRMECGEVDVFYKSKVLNKLEHVIGMYRSLVDNGV